MVREMKKTKYTYDVFLSHSTKDKEFVRVLDKGLRAVGIKTFFDEKDIPWGGNIPKTVETAIDESRHLLLVLSPEAIKSEWVDLERCISLFQSPAGRKGSILPLLRRDCESMPGYVRLLKYLSVRNEEEFEAAWPTIVERLGGTSDIAKSTPILGFPKLGSVPHRKTIAVFCPLFGASKIYYTELLAAITNKAHTYGYGLCIVPVQDIYNKRVLIHHFPQFPSVDGVIFITCQVDNSTWLKECASHAIPVVLLHDNISESQARGYTVVSHIHPKLDALRELVQHLINVHYCRNLTVSMTNPKNHAIRTEKLRIIENAIIDSMLQFTHSKNLYYVADYSHLEGMKVTDRILERNQKTDAIICLADITAIGVIKKLTELGLENQIRVTGFDNIEVAAYNDLTTIDQQLYVTGERSVLDLHNAISHVSCTEFKNISYIPTTLVERGSCCSGYRQQIFLKTTQSRKAIYCLISHPEINDFIRVLRQRVYELELGPFDTTQLIDRASCFPDHVTIIGVFSLDTSILFHDLCSEIEENMKNIGSFIAITKNFQHFPNGSLSIGFTEESRHNFLRIQKILLPVIKKYRRKSVEPEFRQFLYSKDKKEVQYVREFGESYILDRFNPHISILSGLRSQDDYKKVLTFTQDANISGIKLSITGVSLVQEEEIGADWQSTRFFPFKDR